MAIASLDPDDITTYKRPPRPRAVRRALGETWAPRARGQRVSFLPWEEMLEPRFPKPPRLPLDLEPPSPVAANDPEGEGFMLHDLDESDIWTIEPHSRPLRG